MALVVCARQTFRRGLYYTGCSRFSWEIVYNVRERERMCGLLCDLRVRLLLPFASRMFNMQTCKHVERISHKLRGNDYLSAAFSSDDILFQTTHILTPEPVELNAISSFATLVRIKLLRNISCISEIRHFDGFLFPMLKNEKNVN